MDHCFPEYDIWTQFVSADYTRALDLDALDSSHPIEVSSKLIVLKLKVFIHFSNLYILTSLPVNTHIVLEKCKPQFGFVFPPLAEMTIAL